MSCACVLMMILLGSSVVAAFVLPPSKEESGLSVTSTVSHQRCHVESLQSIREGLLESLNLQTEPQVPVGLLENVREQWQKTFSGVSHKTKDAGVPAASANSESDGGNTSSSLKCCSVTSEIFMKDLGWDNWVIYPNSLPMVQCKLCTTERNIIQCPSPHADAQNGQVPCCHPTSQMMVPIVYMDEFGTVVVSSVQLTQSCGCETTSTQ